jgi:outer membrane protein assembly factor BamB
MITRRWNLFRGVLALVVSASWAGGLAVGADWPCWRGPNHDGVTTEKIATWPKDGPRQLWKAEVGPGHAVPSVQGGKVYIMGRAGKDDVVFCFNADTGAVVWKYTYAAKESAYGRGPRATPAVEGKVVYTLSADGQAFCLDTETGQPLWSKNLQKDLNLPMPRHNFATSPVIEGDLLLLNLGACGLALEKKTGNVAWKSEGDSSYSSPVPCTIGGKRRVVLAAASQVAVVDVTNGQKIASVERKIQDNVNCADPVIIADAIFVTSSYNVGSALIRVSGGDAAAAWTKKYGCVYASPVLVGDWLYALVESGWQKADLVCLSVKDGAEKWRQKDVGAGGLIVADGKLLILSRAGELILAEASSTAYTELARTKVFTEGACWNGPVFSDGRVYVRNEKGTLVCLDLRGNKVEK